MDVPIDDEGRGADPPIKMSEREEALWRKTDVHDRSAHLFLLGILLRKSGVRDDLIAAALSKHPLSIDKYFSRTAKEGIRIVDNMNKKGISGADEIVIEHIVSWNWLEFMTKPTRVEWLVRDSWLQSSVGFISGRPKTYKTWTAEDLALSVMTGTKFLDTYRTMSVGPVVLVQEEDPPAVIQERFRLIAEHKGIPVSEVILKGRNHVLSMPNLPFALFPLQGVKIEDDGKMGQVVQRIRELRPSLVVLDPFINLISDTSDEYRGSTMANALQTFKHWREEFGCAVLIVHHWNKGADTGRGGENMYASFAFHAWLESALHIRPIAEEGEQIREVTIEREFKADRSGTRFKVTWDIQTDRPGPDVYQPVVGTQVKTPKDTLIEVVEANDSVDLKNLALITGIPNKQLQPMVNDLLKSKRLQARQEGKSILYSAS